MDNAAAKLLKKLEYIDLDDYEGKRVCPVCGNSPETGHRNYCEMFWVLRRVALEKLMDDRMDRTHV